LIRLLNNSNLLKIFDKGFVYLENESGKKVTKLQELLLGESINLTFSDGKAKSKIVERKLN
jgi:exonuclease VII large subunit